jgi:hypothetical protein
MRTTVRASLSYALLQLVLAVGFAAMPVGYWSTPQPFTPANSTAGDYGITFSHDGLTFYVNSNRGSDNSDIYMSTRADLQSPWSTPTPVTEWNTSQQDGASWVSPDNLEAYLFRHPSFPTTADIYRSVRAQASDPWGTPQLVSQVNTSYGDADLRSFGDGTAAVLASDRNGGNGDFDLWWTTRASTSDPWATPTHISGINSSSYDADASLSDDGLELIFTSNRPGGVGQMDLYVATRGSLIDPWGSPALIPDVNSVDDDINAVLSRDGQTLYFRSTRPGGMGDADIWYSTWVPEPSSLLLIVLGFAAVSARRRAAT